MSSKELAERVEGFVLAGGRSSRFGTDKALARIGEETLLARAAAALAALGLPARVVAPDPSAYGDLAAGAVTGERPGLGPAEGLRAALEAAESPWALVLAADMPGVDAPALRELVAALPGGETGSPRAVCFEDDSGRRSPLPGLYHRSLAGVLAALPDGVALQRLLDRAGVRVLPAPGPDVLANINTARDLERLAHGPERPPEAKADRLGPESD
jgi:molybdopterin-guanine dinucleotide biosynthesis protein A